MPNAASTYPLEAVVPRPTYVASGDDDAAIMARSAIRLPKNATRVELRRHIERQAVEIDQLRNSVEVAETVIKQVNKKLKKDENNRASTPDTPSQPT